MAYRNRFRWLMAGAGAAVLAGCTTTVETRPVAPHAAAGPAPALVGMVYRLPATRFDLVVTRTLVDCAQKGKDALDTRFDVVIEATPATVAGDQFIVDPRSLSKWYKLSASSIERHPNGTIKAFNASATDKSPEIIAGAATAVFKAVRLAAGLPAGGAGAVALVPRDLTCPTTDLERRDALDKENKRLAEAIKLDEIEHHKLQVEAALGTIDAVGTKRLKDLKETIEQNGKLLTTGRAARAEVIASLSHRETYSFMPTADRLAFAAPLPGGDLVRKEQQRWLAKLFSALPKAEETIFDKAVKPQQGWVVVSVTPVPHDRSLCRASGLPDGCGEVALEPWDSTGPARVVPGILYREPAEGVLRVCNSDTADACLAGSIAAAKEMAVSLPQLGRPVILPFSNGWGEDTELKASFSADGQPTKIEYAANSAPGEKAVTTLNGILDGAAALDKDIRAANKAERDADKAEKAAAAKEAAEAPEKALDAQISLAEKQRKLLDAQRAADPTNVALLRELDDLKVRIAKLQAEATLAGLEDPE